MHSIFRIGFHVHEADAEKLCKALNFACELRRGEFTFKYDGRITEFVAPRVLGITPHRIASAVLAGYRIGVLETAVV